ncbi:mannose-binding protein c [Plakobranchus ocellatus]|uniref:Mannose-binding protein c n=1 Tax=Plakobranchus ocellatus TaxID=259542 RepID=A0AAV4BXF8_9GAST|nr:mannose-binding protein c [Plakobranchus ocellatus]
MQEDCENLGGSVATIRSKKESEIVKKFLNKVSFRDWEQPGSDVWLAGSDKGSEGNWYWDTNGQREKISDGFNDWRKGEPNNGGRYSTGEDCMSIAYGDRKWNDIDCSEEKFVMCEIPNTQDVNPITG